MVAGVTKQRTVTEFFGLEKEIHDEEMKMAISRSN